MRLIIVAVLCSDFGKPGGFGPAHLLQQILKSNNIRHFLRTDSQFLLERSSYISLAIIKLVGQVMNRHSSSCRVQILHAMLQQRLGTDMIQSDDVQ